LEKSLAGYVQTASVHPDENPDFHTHSGRFRPAERKKAMSLDFDTSFRRLIDNEGGYVNDPNDPGGETKFGISKHEYPDVDIAALTVDDAKAIYKRDFWDAGHMDMLDPELAFQAFDFAVNSGIRTAIRKLQQAVGAADDGVVGPHTLAAINTRKTTAVVLLYLAARLDYWTRLKKWSVFGAGWVRRAAADLRYAAEDVETEDA
jgi:lysozyme family protein